MPVITKCHCKGCQFEGNHGFTDTVGGIVMFYHNDARDGTHEWYMGTMDPKDIGKLIPIEGEIVEREGKHFLYTPSKSEAFELTVVPRIKRDPKPGDNFWVKGQRARIAGNEPLANALLRKWIESATAVISPARKYQRRQTA